MRLTTLDSVRDRNHPGVHKPGGLARFRPPTLPARTTIIEHLLIAGLILPLPLENYLPTIGRFSVPAVIFVAAAGFLLAVRSWEVLKAASHPVIAAFAALLGVGVLMEMTHETPSFSFISRVAQMLVAAVLVAALVRDRKGVRTGLVCMVMVSVVLAAVLYREGGASLYAVETTDFYDASKAREAAYKDTEIWSDINRLSFLAALGAMVGVLMFLTVRQRWQRILVGVGGLIGFFGTFLTVSRTGIVIVVLSIVCAMAVMKQMRLKALAGVGILLTLTVFVAPDAVMDRLSFGYVDRKGRTEGRAGVYSGVLSSAGDYLLNGVGEYDYWTSWSEERIGRRLGAHNSFLQVTVLWGGLALVAMGCLVIFMYRSLPRPSRLDPLTFCIWGLTAALLLRWGTTHNLYNKEFSVILGLLIGGNLWIWPSRFGRMPTVNRHAQRPASTPQAAPRSMLAH